MKDITDNLAFCIAITIGAVYGWIIFSKYPWYVNSIIGWSYFFLSIYIMKRGRKYHK